MQTTISQATQEQFAMIVQKGMIIGVELAQKAFAENNIQFFEDASADQHRMRETALRNITERVSFDVWLTRAREFDLNSNIVKYDTTGKIQELNDLMFDRYALEYYTAYVVPQLDTPLSTLETNFAMAIQGIQVLVDFLKAGVTEDDKAAMTGICGALTDNVNAATTEQLLNVIKPQV